MAVIAVAVVAALTCVTRASPATAHEVDPDVRFVVEDVTPALPDGVTVVVLRGIAPQVVVENDTDEVLEVLDDAGRPFLRVGPDGVVADVASFAWIDTADPGGVPPGVDVPRDLPPRWETVRDDPSWGWFDHRLHEEPLRFDAPADATVVLDRWQVDLRLGGEPVTVTGRTERAPQVGTTFAALTSGSQPLPGVTVQLLSGALPGLFVTASAEVTVLGQDGEPFLRFGPDGVEANERSPTWLLSGRAVEEGTDPADLDLDPTAEPRWLAVSDGAGFGWLDPRAAAPEVVPAAIEPGSAPIVLTSWEVPVVAVDGTEARIGGETRYAALPAPHGSDTRWPAVAAGGAGAGLLAGGLLLRRRRRSPVPRVDAATVTADRGR